MSLRQGLLALLSEGPKYGYQLKTEFEMATGGMWPVNVGQVYTTLDRLIRHDFVEAVDRSGQKEYRLTPAGSRQLAAWWQSTPGDAPPPRDELMVKVLLAVATAPGDALDVITAQRTAVLEVLQRRRQAQRQALAAAVPLADRLADDALVVRAESDLRWLDLCEARLLAEGASSKAPSSQRPSSGAQRFATDDPGEAQSPHQPGRSARSRIARPSRRSRTDKNGTP